MTSTTITPSPARTFTSGVHASLWASANGWTTLAPAEWDPKTGEWTPETFMRRTPEGNLFALVEGVDGVYWARV